MNRHLTKALNIQGNIDRLDIQQQACFRKYLLSTPYQIGRVIPCQDYLYQGKKMEITQVSMSIHKDLFWKSNKFHITVYGNILNSDGRSEEELYSFDQILCFQDSNSY